MLECPRGKALGGSSSINAMVYVRGHAFDYDRWARDEGCAGWGYADVLPYFRRAQAGHKGVPAPPMYTRMWPKTRYCPSHHPRKVRGIESVDRYV